MKIIYLFIVFLYCVFTFSSCRTESPVFGKDDFKRALKTIFQQKSFIANSGINFNAKRNFIIYTDFRLVDTMHVMGNTFYINIDPKNENFKEDQVIRVNVNHPNPISTKFILDYTPSPYFSLNYELECAFKDGKWSFYISNSKISDKVHVESPGKGIVIDDEFIHSH
jgi:hypothetical protein